MSLFEKEPKAPKTKVEKPVHHHVYEKSPTQNENWKLQVYRCKYPTCKHYTAAQFIFDKTIECYKCHKLTIASKLQLQRGRKGLVCVYCTSTKQAKVHSKARAVVLDMLSLVKSTEEVNEVEMIPYTETIQNITKGTFKGESHDFGD